MIVGYVDSTGEMYCVTCWTAKVSADRTRPVRLLTTEVGDRRDNFRIIDDGRRCGAKLDYQDLQALA